MDNEYEFLSPEWWEWWSSEEHQREYQKQIDDGLYAKRYDTTKTK